jgi:hypothetical protein
MGANGDFSGFFRVFGVTESESHVWGTGGIGKVEIGKVES